jgi:hypothetical protein
MTSHVALGATFLRRADLTPFQRSSSRERRRNPIQASGLQAVDASRRAEIRLAAIGSFGAAALEQLSPDDGAPALV